MRTSPVIVALLALSSTAAAQFQATAPQGKRAAKQTQGASSAFLTPPGGGSFLGGGDDCTTPTLIAGQGVFPLDSSVASTGLEGQNESTCYFFGATGIDADVWFEWTADATGDALIQSCGLAGHDTKIAAYAGGGCPVDGTSLACNDDSCGLQSSMGFAVTAGTTYSLQVGSFPGASGGAGGIDISIAPTSTGYSYDDGVTDNLVGLGGAGGVVWLQGFDAVGGQDTLGTISTAFGCALIPGLLPGADIEICVWDDPTNDFDPSDAVLLYSQASVASDEDTDILVNFGLPNIAVNGVFFIGVAYDQVTAQNPAPLDQSVTSSGRAWILGNTQASGGYAGLDVNVLTNNDLPPTELDSIGIPGVWLLRTDKSSDPCTTGEIRRRLTGKGSSSWASDVQNVGEYTRFEVIGVSNIQSYQWSVSGPILNNYFEQAGPLGDPSAANAGLLPWSVVPMVPADFTNPRLSFYWEPMPVQRWDAAFPNTLALPRTVTVEITKTDETVCSLELVVMVERNPSDVCRQPQDFYTENHRSAGSTVSLREHVFWHNYWNFGRSDYGKAFFLFHAAYISRFDSWRQTFGYPPVGIWNPATPIPLDDELCVEFGPNSCACSSVSEWDPVLRNPYTPGNHELPPWFQTPPLIYTGSEPLRNNVDINCGIDSDGFPNGGVPSIYVPDFGQDNLWSESPWSGFENLDHLGRAIIRPYHDCVHGDIGGTMGDLTSPRDGIFWRWHNFLTSICVTYLENPNGFLRVAEVSPLFVFENQVDPPPKVFVKFAESAIGVTADLLTVNGSPATQVSGSGEGYYVFSGYAVPTPGPMKIELNPGSIQDTLGRIYEGDLWCFQLLDPLGDEDGDTLTNGDEVRLYYSDPYAPDSDQDCFSDLVEVTAGTDPINFEDRPASVGTPYCTTHQFHHEMVNCPCWNAGSALGGCANSTGLGALMCGGGSPSVSADDLTLSASALPPGQFGVFFMGGGQIRAPFGDGFRCVGSTAGQTIHRFNPPMSSGAQGVANLAGAISGSGQISAGQTWNFQFWYRDPSGPCGTAYNLSSALSVVFQP
ncbi:MAG: hypothetical protein ACI835_004356 [Planctomycetota bacterium]